VLLNPWKHHVGFLRQCIAEVSSEDDLQALARRLTVIGTDLMDLYHGRLALREISASLIGELSRQGHLELAAFGAWLATAGGYVVVSLPQDGSRWVLRLAPPPRYVHVHPGRYSPHTLRVRATVLKTAVMALATVHLHGGDPLGRNLLDRVRLQALQLPPLGKDPTRASGLGAVVSLLQAP
jgi:hypothetical protein